MRRSDVDRYARAANDIANEAVKDLDQVLDLVADLPLEEAIAELQAILPDLVDYHGETLAAVAAEWYEQLRDAEGLFTATLADSYSAEQIQGTVKYAGKFLAAGDQAAARQLLAGAMQRWIMYSGRETVARNVRLDPSKPRFARVPVGETCAWCDMLASRGWVYHSKETAGINGGYHDHCNCQIVPSWDAGKAHLEGYDPDDLYEKYMAARQELEAEGWLSPSDAEVAAWMQKLFPERYGPKLKADVGTVLIPDGVSILDHELATARRLADAGHRIEFLPIKHGQGVKNLDVLIDGVPGELKSPEGAGNSTISNQFRRAKEQGATRLVIDTARTPLEDQLIKAEMQRRFNGSDWLQELCFIGKDGSVEWLKKSR